MLDNVSDNDITNLNIPTGIPLVYELDDRLKPLNHYYLGEAAEVEKATIKISKQGKSNE